MNISTEIILGILEPIFLRGDAISANGQKYPIERIASKIALGLNDIIAKGDQMEFLKSEQFRIDAEHIEATGELEAEMVRIQEECPHFTFSQKDIPPRNCFAIVSCDICGKILEQETIGNVE